MDDKEQQRLFKGIVAQLAEVFDNLPADLHPDTATLTEALAATLRLDPDGNVAFGTADHGFYRAGDGRAWWWERRPGPKGTVIVEYKGGAEVSRALVARPPELN
jgi:hypothetical protein